MYREKIMLTTMKVSVLYWGGKKAQERVKTIGKTLPGETYISLVSSQESEIAGNRNDA